MIVEILTPYIAERFKNEKRYREGHLRVVNALPHRKVLGMHVPDMKKIAKALAGDDDDIISRFRKTAHSSLVHEEIVIWGLIINSKNCSVDERFAMLRRFVPIIDNWAVCDTFCADAKWLRHVDKGLLWSFLSSYLSSHREFEVRFAVVASMCYLLEKEWLGTLFAALASIDYDNIKSEYVTCATKAAKPQSGTVCGREPYYVRMAVAWLLATSLAKFPLETRGLLSQTDFPEDVLRMYVRKAKDSFRTRNVNPF